MRRLRLFLLILVSSFCSAAAWGQVATGFPPFGSFSGSSFDSVNNANLNVHFGIPVVDKAGRGLPFYYILSYDSSVWRRVTVSGTLRWQPVVGWGWSGITDASTGYTAYNVAQHSCWYKPTNKTYFWNDYTFGAYYDAAGTGHAMFSVTVSDYSRAFPAIPCGSDLNPYTASTSSADGSGYTFSVGASPSSTAYSPSGVTITTPLQSPTGNGSLVDPNGNTLTVASSGGTTTFTDTLAKTAMKVTGSGTPASPVVLSYTAAGGAGSATIHYFTKTVQTSFGCTGISDFGPTAENLVSSVVLQDGETYAFTYESTPGHAGNYTGRIASVTLPTGGVINYTYSGGSGGITCADGSTATLTRQTPDGTWTYTHTESGTPWTTTVGGPLSYSATYNFEQVSGSQNVYETERQVAGLETIYTCYNGAAKPCNPTNITLPINRRTVWTTLGTQTSEVDTTYNILPTEVDEYDWGPSLARKTIISYNESSCGVTNTHVFDVPCSVAIQNSAGTQVASTAFSYNANGNMLSVTSNGLTSNFTYNSNGTMATSTDTAGNQTTYNYGGNSCGAFPDSVTMPLSLSTSAVWNCDGAVPTSSTDANGKATSFTYDTMNRLIRTTYPDSIGTVTNAYNISRTSPNTTVTYTNVGSSGGSRQDTTNLDGLGRVKDQTVRGVKTDTSYDALGRVSMVSIENSGGAEDTYGYDGLDRLTGITHADSNTVSTSWSNPQCPTTTDEAGKTNQVCSDALGRISKVIDGLGNETDYTYDALDDLTKVTQGSQTRSFGYDSLGRLTSATTPESGATAYTYDTDATCGTSHGNLVKRLDARSIRTCYLYDALNRLTQKNYSDGTPTASFIYDASQVFDGNTTINTKGRMSVTWNGLANTTYSYDAVGRVTDYWQSEPAHGSLWKLHYNYDLPGDILSWTHPSGTTITNTVNTDQQVTQIQSSLNDSNHPNPLVQNISYTPWGVIQTVTDGCAGTGCVQRQETYDYNNRLQPVRIQLGTNSTPSANYCLVYNYYTSLTAPGSCGIPSQGTGDNGSAVGYLYVDNINPTLSHSTAFTYDGVQRLATAAASHSGSGTISYSDTYNYDRYGNMSWLPGGSGPVLTYIGSSNHVNQIGSLFAGYDSAGDMTSDGTSTYQYDGEGRMTAIVQGGSTYQTNTYNSLGQLVESDFPGFNAKVLAAFDASGRELGQYNGVGGYWWDQDVRAGGRMLAQEQTGTTYFLHANTLGSDTQLTNQAGAVLMDMLYYPWGEVWQTAGSTVDSHFAGFQKSAGPIFQTPNRSYLGTLGRWTTPDPLGGDVTNPQSLNRYAYVGNNPTTFTDPLGLYNPFECDPLDPIDCGPPPCDPAVWNDCGPCIPGFGCPPVGGGGGGGGSSGGGGGGAPAPPSAPPAGQPPMAGGSEFLHNPLPCLSPAQLAMLKGALIAGAATVLGLSANDLSPTNATISTSVQGGSLNVLIQTPSGGFPVTPTAAGLSTPLHDPIFEPGFNTQIRADGIVPVGPGTSYHVVLNTGTNAQGQQVITGVIKVHADIGNPATGGSLRHGILDVGAASIFSRIQGGFPGCPVKFD